MTKNLQSIAGSGGGCFRKGTMVQREDGRTTPIESLKVGDAVLSFDQKGAIHRNNVTAVHFHSSPEPLLHVLYWGGDIYLTPNHWVLNQYNAFVEMGTLSIEDAFVDGMGHLRPIISITPIDPEPVYNLTVEGDHTFIADNVRVHNGGHRARHPMVIAGSGGGGGKGGGGSHTPVTDPDSLQSHQYANVIDLVSEGPIVGLIGGLQGVYLNNTPLQNSDGSFNFQGATVTYTTGTPSQNAILSTAPQGAEVAVGVKALNASPVIRTITTPNLTRIRVTVSVPALQLTDLSTGDTHGNTVTLRVSLNSNGGGYVAQYNDTISGKSSSKYERSYLVTLPTGTSSWAVKLERVSADSVTTYDQRDLYWESYTEIIDTQLNYPYSALIGLQIDSQYFNSVPTRGYHIKGLQIQIPSNYNPITRAYTGTWDGTFVVAWTNNPAWCYYDMLTNPRYGLGKYINAAQVDKWALYTIAQYCDALVSDGFGGWEPRFTCNLYLQSPAEAFKVLSDMASIFRGMMYWAAGQIELVQDSPKTVSALFTRANIIDGSFSYAGTSLKARHTVALVTWNDPNDMYQPKVEYVEDGVGIAKYGVQQTQVTAFGCTSRGQAHRLGLWTLYTERIETETITFKTGLEHTSLRPGMIFNTSDPIRAGVRFGGRVLPGATSYTFYPDSTISLLAGKTYTASVMLPSGAVETYTVANAVPSTVGPSSAVSVNGPFTTVPQDYAVFIIAQNDLQPEQWRCVSIAESDNMVAEIVGLKYNPSKYGAVDSGFALVIANTNQAVVAIPAAVTNVVCSDNLYIAGPLTLGTKVVISWTGMSARYVVTAINNTHYGNQVTETVVSPSWEMQDARDGDNYTFTITALNPLGAMGPTTTVSYTVIGKQALPSNVTGLSAVVQTAGILLTWNASTDLDFSMYELRMGAVWSSAAFIAQPTTETYLWAGQMAGTYPLKIKAVDTSGNYSATENSLNLVVVGPAACNPAYQIVDAYELLNWLPPASPFTIDRYEIRYGASWAAGVYMDSIKGSSYRRRVDYLGSRTYWVAAVDIIGNYGAASSVTCMITAPGIVLGTRVDIVDNNALLYWLPPTVIGGNLPIDHYEIRKGPSWAAYTSIIGSNGNSTFCSVFEQQSGTYNYWVAGVDTAGNYGVAVAITASISQPPDYVLRTSIDSIFAPTTSTGGDTTAVSFTNVLKQGSILTLPVNTTETWTQHFTNHSWTSPQDQINAGYPVYVEPSLTSAVYTETIDYGTVLPNTTVSVTINAATITGTVSLACSMQTKALSTDAWSSAYAGTSMLAGNFRYVLVTLTATATGGLNIMNILGINIKLSTKTRNDNGTGVSVIGGATVTFQYPFIQADTPVVQPNGLDSYSKPYVAAVIFAGTPGLTTFSVRIFNSAGTEVAGVPFSWTAKGY